MNKMRRVVITIAAIVVVASFFVAQNKETLVIASEVGKTISVNYNFEQNENGWQNTCLNGIFIASSNGEVIVSSETNDTGSLCCSQNSSEDFTRGYIKMNGGDVGVECIKISLSSQVKTAKINVSCGQSTTTTQEKSRQIWLSKEVCVGDKIENIEISEHVLLYDTKVNVESKDDIVAKDLNFSVDGQTNYYINCSKIVYVLKIEIEVQMIDNCDYVSQVELLENGILPKTLSIVNRNNMTYKFLGWVNSEYQSVEHSQIVPKGKYYTVYVSIESYGAKILLRKDLTAINFGFSVKFLDETVAQNIFMTSNPSIIFEGCLLPDGNDSVRKMELENYSITNGQVEFFIAIYNIPNRHFDTEIKTKIGIRFGDNTLVDSGWLLERSISYVATATLNDLSDNYSTQYCYEVVVFDGFSNSIKFSQYSEASREILTSFVLEEVQYEKSI